jgi:signal transduction histidine kinase
MAAATPTTSDTGMAGDPPAEPIVGRRWHRVPLDVVSGRTWRATGHLVLDLPIGVVTFTTVVTLFVTAVATIIVFPIAIVAAAGLLVASRLFAAFERFRAGALLDVRVDPPRRGTHDRRLWARFKAQVFVASTWREVLYSLLLLPVGAVTFSVALVAWCVPLTLVTLPATIWAVPGHEISIGTSVSIHGWYAAAPAFVVGVVLLLLVPFLIRGLAFVDGHLMSALLGPGRAEQLGERVAELTESRSRVVDAVELDRRRIERDLHDGAQQRLVALAMDLGRAQEKFDTDPDAAQALVADAHREAKQALVELRDLARGIHPAVLTDRGLDAALSSVAARSPVPVRLTVDVRERPSPTIEGIAYFVVCEALTNVAKHANAQRAAVTVSRLGDRLLVEITDDGHGGADVAAGTGLTGLRDRVEGVDGWLHVSSPSGGPTTIMAELPCGS